MKCMKCGKEAYKSTTTEAIELITEAFKQLMQEITVVDYEKAAA